MEVNSSHPLNVLFFNKIMKSTKVYTVCLGTIFKSIVKLMIDGRLDVNSGLYYNAAALINKYCYLSVPNAWPLASNSCEGSGRFKWKDLSGPIELELLENNSYSFLFF